jgi:hypothetical protein
MDQHRGKKENTNKSNIQPTVRTKDDTESKSKIHPEKKKITPDDGTKSKINIRPGDDLFGVVSSFLGPGDIVNYGNTSTTHRSESKNNKLTFLTLEKKLTDYTSVAREFPNVKELKCNFELTDAELAKIAIDFGKKLTKLTTPAVYAQTLTFLTMHKMKLNMTKLYLTNFNQRIEIGELPESLESLTFGARFDTYIHPNVLPNSLRELVFGESFNRVIMEGVLPMTLESLTLGASFNTYIAPKVLPDSLRTLVFGESFNSFISEGVLPVELESLTFGYMFNRYIDPGVLPACLRKLVFGYSFNRPIAKGVLPMKLESLTFDEYGLFDSEIDQEAWPVSLTSLTFGTDFNKSTGILPDSLVRLQFGHSFNQQIQKLPNSLVDLVFGFFFNQQIDHLVWPNNLTNLTVWKNFQHSTKSIPKRIQIARVNRVDYEKNRERLDQLRLQAIADSTSWDRKHY